MVFTEEVSLAETVAGQQLGTPAYMAPEQAEGRIDLIDGRTDIYGLGTILYEILTGRPPHQGESILKLLDQIARGETPRVLAVEQSAPPALDAICAKAMAKDRNQRYATAADLAEEIQCWLADEPVHAYRASWLELAAKWSFRQPAAAAWLGLLPILFWRDLSHTLLAGGAIATMQIPSARRTSGWTIGIFIAVFVAGVYLLTLFIQGELGPLTILLVTGFSVIAVRELLVMTRSVAAIPGPWGKRLRNMIVWVFVVGILLKVLVVLVLPRYVETDPSAIVMSGARYQNGVTWRDIALKIELVNAILYVNYVATCLVYALAGMTIGIVCGRRSRALAFLTYTNERVVLFGSMFAVMFADILLPSKTLTEITMQSTEQLYGGFIMRINIYTWIELLISTFGIYVGSFVGAWLASRHKSRSENKSTREKGT